jgi:hypothetical protein
MPSDALPTASESPPAPPRWRQALVWLPLVLAMIACGVGQGVLYWWYVEDSAISMAFARNLADGWGLVRFPGDARVEGYSNPLWVFWMAAGFLVGVDGWWSTKIAAGVLGCLVSVPLAYVLVRRAGLERGWGWIGAWVLALDAQFIIWSACGLENSLFCALLALGCWRTLHEAEEGGFPWAAVAFFGLALTRPEGIVYAAFGGFWALVLEATGKRRWLRIVGWLAVFWVPFLAYHAARYAYFAYPFPATYYAKLGETQWNPWRWNGRAWNYLRDYSFETGRGFLLPIVIAGTLGLRGWRGVSAVALSVWIGGLLVYPGVEPLLTLGWPRGLPTPPNWIELRVVSLGVAALAVPLLALGQKGWRVRVLCWGMALVAILFSLRSTGDWMRGFRWMSLCAVPLAVLIGLGCGEIAEGVQRVTANRSEAVARWGRRAGIALGTLVFIGAIVPQVAYQVGYKPEVGPFAVQRRVNHYAWAMRKLHLEHAEIVDHDMGAMLYWGGELGIVRDARGLVDMPFAVNQFDRRFVEEYLFEEHVFDLCHAHASTGRAVKRVGRRWREEYVEFPGYGKGPHQGNFFRKDLLMSPWDGPTDRAVQFADGVTLHGMHVRAPEVQVGSWMFVEMGWSTRRRPVDPFRVWFVLVRESPGKGPTIVPLDVPLGLEDWYPVTDWKDGEVFDGRITLPLPKRLTPGTYGVALVVTDSDGVLAAETVGAAGTLDHEPHYAMGEVYFPDVIEVRKMKGVKRAAAKDIGRAVEHANALRCAEAEVAWEDARAHYMRSKSWQDSVRPPVQNAVANCWALAAEGAPDRAAAVEAIRAARRWDRTHPTVLRVGDALAEQWIAEGLAAREAGDVERAYGDFRDALYANPGRAWARRWAEDLRALRLDLK